MILDTAINLHFNFLFLLSPLHHVHITAYSLILVLLPASLSPPLSHKSFFFQIFLGYFFHPLYEPSLTLLGTLMKDPLLGPFSLSNQERASLIGTIADEFCRRPEDEISKYAERHRTGHLDPPNSQVEDLLWLFYPLSFEKEGEKEYLTLI